MDHDHELEIQGSLYLSIDGQQRVLRRGVGEDRDVPYGGGVLDQAVDISVQLGGALREGFQFVNVLQFTFLGEVLRIFYEFCRHDSSCKPCIVWRLCVAAGDRIHDIDITGEQTSEWSITEDLVLEGSDY